MSDAQTTKKKLNINVKEIVSKAKPQNKEQWISTGVLAVVSVLTGFVTGKLTSTSKGKKKDQ